jgi:hypothetical protein
MLDMHRAVHGPLEVARQARSTAADPGRGAGGTGVTTCLGSCSCRRLGRASRYLTPRCVLALWISSRLPCICHPLFIPTSLSRVAQLLSRPIISLIPPSHFPALHSTSICAPPAILSRCASPTQLRRRLNIRRDSITTPAPSRNTSKLIGSACHPRRTDELAAKWRPVTAPASQILPT